VHFALVTVSESSKVPKSRLYVQTRGIGTLGRSPCGASDRPFVPSLRPRPIRADARDRDEGTKGGRDGAQPPAGNGVAYAWRYGFAVGDLRGSGQWLPARRAALFSAC
jgi:hypothetical protein